MYKCKCGKEYSTVASYGAHCSHCIVHLGHEDTDRFGDSRAWNRGKTKYTDPRIASMALAQKQKIADGVIPKSFLGKRHSEETKKKMSESARKVALEHRNGWKCGNSRIQNKYEQFTSEFLESNGISYQAEVTIPQSKFGKTGSYYQFDFLIDGIIDLEIDGTSHITDQQIMHDAERDSYVCNLYKIYRIQHNDDIDTLRNELELFLCKYKNGELTS